MGEGLDAGLEFGAGDGGPGVVLEHFRRAVRPAQEVQGAGGRVEVAGTGVCGARGRCVRETSDPVRRGHFIQETLLAAGEREHGLSISRFKVKVNFSENCI